MLLVQEEDRRNLINTEETDLRITRNFLYDNGGTSNQGEKIKYLTNCFLTNYYLEEIRVTLHNAPKVTECV